MTERLLALKNVQESLTDRERGERDGERECERKREGVSERERSSVGVRERREKDR